MDTSSFMGLSAIFAGIAMAWGKIKMAFSHLSSIIIETYTFETQTDLSLFTRYILDEKASSFKRISINKLMIGSRDSYIRPLRRRGEVAFFKGVFSGGSFFLKGKKVLFVGGEMGGSNSPGRNSSFGGSGGRVSFVRGTFSMKDLMKSAIEYCYDQRAESILGQTNSRFFIEKIQGTSAKRIRNTNMAGEGFTLTTLQLKSALSPSPETSSENCLQDMVKGNDVEIIKWAMSDIGDENEGKCSFSHLAFPDEVGEFITEAETWMKSKDWFLKNKIPWRRGWLLHGTPGNGKSSLSRSLAEYLGIPLIIFDLSDMDNNEFSSGWDRVIKSYTPCVVLIEDIDAIFCGRENVTGKDGLTFDCLLNNLSGASNSDGVFLIITTNKIECIDDALGRPVENDGTHQSTRPGRIDRVLELKNPSKENLTKIAKRILSICPQFIESTVEAGINDSGAQFQERCARIALNEFWKNKENKETK